MLNKIILIGNLGNDPKQIGEDAVSISLATSEKYKDKAGTVHEKTEWHKVVIFNKNKAKYVMNYFKKGDKAYVEGSIRTSEYEKDGVKKYSTEVIVGNFSGEVKMIGSKDGNV